MRLSICMERSRVNFQSAPGIATILSPLSISIEQALSHARSQILWLSIICSKYLNAGHVWRSSQTQIDKHHHCNYKFS